MSEKPKQIDMNEAAKVMADAVNGVLNAGVPIPFVLATMALIHHDLCNQQIAMTNQMAQIAKGNVPKPNLPGPDRRHEPTGDN